MPLRRLLAPTTRGVSMSPVDVLIGLVVGALVLGPIAFVVGRRQGQTTARVDTAAKAAEAERIIQEAEARKRELQLEARDEALKIRSEAEQELKQRRADTQQQERRL